MPPSKFEANPMLHRGVKRASFSLFTLASLCANAYFRAYAIIDFLADRLVFLNTVTLYIYSKISMRLQQCVRFARYARSLSTRRMVPIMGRASS